MMRWTTRSGTVNQVHGPAHALDHLAGDHPVGEVASSRDLHRAKDRGVDLAGADHAETRARVEEAGSRADGCALLARVDQVRILVPVQGLRTGAEDAVLGLQGQLDVDVDKVVTRVGRLMHFHRSRHRRSSTPPGPGFPVARRAARPALSWSSPRTGVRPPTCSSAEAARSTFSLTGSISSGIAVAGGGGGLLLWRGARPVHLHMRPSRPSWAGTSARYLPELTKTLPRFYLL
jgi:hypothetical protein